MTQHPAAARPSLDDATTLRELSRYLREGLYVTDADGRIVDASAAFVEIAGATSIDELTGRAFDELLADPAPRRAALAHRVSGARELDVTIVRPDGEQRHVLDTFYHRTDGEGRTFVYGIVSDATAQRTLEARLRESATRDALTGAYNERQLESIGRELARETDGGWGCIYVDVEHFGLYNVRHGREAGDEALVRMARFLMRHVRADEPVIRLANDEFVVILRGATDQRTERVARRLQLTALRTAPIPFALGWAVREGAEPIESLVERAAARQVPVRVVQRLVDPRGAMVGEPASV